MYKKFKKRVKNFAQHFFKFLLQMITMGGDAELELVDSLDPFSEGIVFSVRPPKKSWKNISNLSGGEKTLSSLALVCVCVCVFEREREREREREIVCV